MTLESLRDVRVKLLKVGGVGPGCGREDGSAGEDCEDGEFAHWGGTFRGLE